MCEEWRVKFPRGINMTLIEERGDGLDTILDIISETIEALLTERRVGDSDSNADTVPSVYSRADTV